MPTLDQVLDAIEKVESGGNPYARSPAGAMGAYQFMPATAREYGLTNPYDKRASRAAAERKMQDLLREYDGDLTHAVAAYNLGQGNLRKVGGDWTRVPETNQYVHKVAAASMAKQKPVQDDEWEDVTEEYRAKLAESPDDEWEDVTDQYRAKLAEPEPMEPAPKDPGSLMTGINRQFDKQLVGAQQIGSDIARWASGETGKPYSAYREGVNDRGRVLARESQDAPLMDKVGEGLATTLETIFLPQGKTLPAQMMAGAGIGGTLGALEPADSPVERGARAGKGAAFGGTFPAAAAGFGKGAGWTMGIFSKRRGAAREIDRQFGGVDLGDIEAPSPFKDAKPVDEIGPRLPKYSRVPGVQPTAGYLTNNQKLLQLEMAARDRNIGGKFSERDVLNTKAVYDLIDSKALSQQQREALRNKLNSDTGPLRIEAFDKARGADYSSPLIQEVERLETMPGVRLTPGSKQLVPLTKEKLELDNLQPEDIAALRDDISDSLKASGINLDAKTLGIKKGRREAVQVKQAIDKGLNEASGGAWDEYLSVYREGKKPIREAKAFDDILQSTRTNKPLPIDNSEARNITPAGLRRAADSYTYDEFGRKGLVDILQPENRMSLDEAISVLNDMEKARGGAMAVNGSRSASALTNLVRQGFKASSGKLQAALSLADALGRARGVAELDDTLLNPEKLQTLLDLYKRMKAPPSGLEKLTSRAARSATAYGGSR